MTIAETLKASQWAKLRALAEKATPGSWYAIEGNVEAEEPGVEIPSWRKHVCGYAPDAEYIAMCSPSGVLKLLDEVERLANERIYRCEKCQTPFQYVTNEDCLACQRDVERERVRILRDALGTIAECLDAVCKEYGEPSDYCMHCIAGAALAEVKND